MVAEAPLSSSASSNGTLRGSRYRQRRSAVGVRTDASKQNKRLDPDCGPDLRSYADALVSWREAPLVFDGSAIGSRIDLSPRHRSWTERSSSAARMAPIMYALELTPNCYFEAGIYSARESGDIPAIGEIQELRGARQNDPVSRPAASAICAHYCTAAQPRGDTRLVACARHEAAFASSTCATHSNPREVAYYKPPIPPVKTSRIENRRHCESYVRLTRI